MIVFDADLHSNILYTKLAIVIFDIKVINFPATVLIFCLLANMFLKILTLIVFIYGYTLDQVSVRYSCSTRYLTLSACGSCVLFVKIEEYIFLVY